VIKTFCFYRLIVTNGLVGNCHENGNIFVVQGRLAVSKVAHSTGVKLLRTPGIAQWYSAGLRDG
jgi:hypothetical protein